MLCFPRCMDHSAKTAHFKDYLKWLTCPYVGCGVLASSCGMDKVTMKSLFVEAGLPICKHIWFLRSQWRKDPAKVIRKVTSGIGLPCFVKPANLGSSVGVSRATDKKSLSDAIDLAAEYDRKIIIEEELVAREIECAVLGNDEPKASLPGEYVVYDETARFLDYTEKYTNTGNVSFVVPAPLSKSMTTKIQRMAIRAFQSIDGAGLARVDFFLPRNGGELVINELNTMPGLTEVSGYPKMWAASGLPFPKLLEVLIELAFERHQEKVAYENSSTRVETASAIQIIIRRPRYPLRVLTSSSSRLTLTSSVRHFPSRFLFNG